MARGDNTKVLAIKLQLKTCFIHEITERLIAQVSQADLAAYKKLMRHRLVRECGFMMVEAKRMVDQAHVQAIQYVDIHKNVSSEGLGRQTDFVGIAAQLLKDIRTAELEVAASII